MPKLGYTNSALNTERTNELPKIYHRPQEASWVKTELRRKVRSFDTHAEFTRTFDNPEVNLLKQFEPKPSPINLEVTRDYVVSYNHEHRRVRDAEYLTRLRVNYLASLEICNLCWKCRNPIKTVSASIHRGKSAVRSLADIKGIAAIPAVQIWDPVVEKYFVQRGSDAVTKTYDKKRKLSTSTPDGSGNTNKVEFKGKLFRQSSPAKNTWYADVLCHFETRKSPDNPNKWIYVWVDGTGVEKGLKYVGKKKNERFFDIATGEDLPRYKKFKSYRVFNVRCGCKVR